jgi:hypothetical protein
MHEIMINYFSRQSSIAFISTAMLLCSCSGCGSTSNGRGTPDAGIDSGDTETETADTETNDTDTETNDTDTETTTDTAAKDAGAFDSGLPPDQAWIQDPKLWVELEGAEFTKPECTVYEGRHKLLPPLTLEWEDCGSGCEWADVVRGVGIWGYRPIIGTYVHDQEENVVFHITSGISVGTASAGLSHVVQLDTGKNIGMLKRVTTKNDQWSYCGFSSYSVLNPGVMGGEKKNDENSASSELIGRITFDGSPWTWGRPSLLFSQRPPAYHTFTTEYDGGSIFYVGGGAVYVREDMSSSQVTTIENPSDSLGGAGQGDLAIWTDYDINWSPPRIRGWAPDGKGVRTIVERLPYDSKTIAVSPTNLVGLMGEHKGGYPSGEYANAWIWYVPRAHTTAEVTLQQHQISAIHGYTASKIITWGDYAGLCPYHEEEQFFEYIIVHLPTWTVWRLNPLAGRQWKDAFAFDSNYLYIFGKPADEGSKQRTDRLYRFELAKIADWATKVDE